jgi:Spy/CpxP family protein refolding chaperone
MNSETRQKARLWLGLVFILGAAIGGVFGYSFAHRSYAATQAPAATLSEPERRAKRVAEMTKEVGLTPEQSTQIDQIIHQAHEEMKTIHEKSDADVDVVRQRAREQMRSLLTPDQGPKFEAMIQRMDQERKKQQGVGK